MFLCCIISEIFNDVLVSRSKLLLMRMHENQSSYRTTRAEL